MSDVRKVAGDLLNATEELRVVHGVEVSERVGLTATIVSAKQFLQSLPAEGGAWYPTPEDVFARGLRDGGEELGRHIDVLIGSAIDLYRERAAAPAMDAWYPSVASVCGIAGYPPPNVKNATGRYLDTIIRAAIDLYKERGGQVGGFEPDPDITEKWESGELGRSAEHARVVNPSHSPEVVAVPGVVPAIFDRSSGRASVVDDHQATKYFENVWIVPVSAYSQPAAQPAGVPADVMADAQWLMNSIGEANNPAMHQAADRLVRFLQSLQGAGHGQG